MPPKSTKASNGTEPTSKVPSSRRSARLAGGPAKEEKQTEESKKRSANGAAEKPTASKKAKPASDAAPKVSKGKASGKATSKAGAEAGKSKEAIAEQEGGEGGEETKEEEEKKAQEEKEEEAPASAKSTGKQLKVGDKLPKLVLKDEEGKEVDVSGLAGEKGVVVFLYPKADTPGCTNQACGFRDAFDEIAGFGYEIYGLSKDKPEAQKKWKNKKELNYHLLSDPESKLIKRLGAFVLPNNTKRSHFIFEKGTGKLVDVDLGVKPATDPGNCLKFLQSHHKA